MSQSHPNGAIILHSKVPTQPIFLKLLSILLTPLNLSLFLLLLPFLLLNLEAKRCHISLQGQRQEGGWQA